MRHWAAERRRIAGDLHDGLAQDLAFIAAHSDRLARIFGGDHPLAIAAARALATSQEQIVDLEASGAPTTAAALREVAAEAQARYDVRITVQVQSADQSEPSSAERAALVRIAREAIANAVRHGRARQITVTLGARDEPFLLRVTDDGSGLPAPVNPRLQRPAPVWGCARWEPGHGGSEHSFGPAVANTEGPRSRSSARRSARRSAPAARSSGGCPSDRRHRSRSV